MHYSHVVFIAESVDPDKLATTLDEAMEPFDENRTVDRHRDTSPYAESRNVSLAKARDYAKRKGESLDGMTEDAILIDWEGNIDYDTDGWPMTTRNPDGYWDYWRIGGRWADEWVLKSADDDGPLDTESQTHWDAPKAPDHDRPTTNNARLSAIEAESIATPYSWIDLEGTWHTRWIGPTAEEATASGMPSDTSHWEVDGAVHTGEFYRYLASLPSETWLVKVDYHS